jgi:hypothetical protein
MALREVAADLQVNVKGAEKVEKLEHEVDALHKTLHEFGQSIKSFAVEGAEIFAIGELKEFVHGQVELGEALERTSAKTGLSTDELQKWQYVAEQSALGTDEVAGALGRLQSQLGGGAKGRHGMAGASQELQKLGIHAKDAAGKARPVGDIFMDVADKIKKTEDPTKRAAIAVQVFGRQGREMLPVLMKGRDGIEEMTKEAEKLGFILGDDFLEKTKKAAEEETKLNWSMRDLKATVATELFPAFTKILDKTMLGVAWFSQLAKQTTIVKSGLMALGFVAGVRLLGPLQELMGIAKGSTIIEKLFGAGKTVAAVAGLALLYVAWDEIFGLFTGKDTLVGHMVDRIFGKGTSAQFVKDAGDAWKEIMDSIFGADQAGNDFKSTLNDLVTSIFVFGRVAGRIFSSVIAEIMQMVAAAKLAYMWITTAKGGSQKGLDAARTEYDQAKTTKEKLESSILDMSGINWNSHPTEYSEEEKHKYMGALHSKPRAKGTRQPIGMTIVQHFHGPADPAKVKQAANSGTNQALSQNDLQHTNQAVRSTTPPVGNNYNPVGNP